MSHIPDTLDADLHDEYGHISTAPTTNGHELANHERRIRAHLEAHRRQEAKP